MGDLLRSMVLFGLVSGTLYIAWQVLSARLGQ